MNRKGQEIVPVGEPDDNLALGPTLSHDGTFLAMYRTVNGKSDIWVMEIARGIPVRFSTGTGTAANPLWTPDRRRIVFSSNRNGTFDLYARSIASQETEPLVQTDQPKSATSWSPDGRTLLYRALSPGSGYDIWALPFDEAGRPGVPYPVVASPYDERDAEFSPSGTWIAYQSNRSGRPEVHVQSFPPDGASLPCPVSTRGGAQPRWGADDSELFYVALDGWLMSVAIDYSPDGRILIHPAERLFLTQIGGAVHSINRPQYMVARDGRFLMNMLTENHSSIELILGWNARP
jgi:Tol biopolymer transport system component